MNDTIKDDDRPTVEDPKRCSYEHPSRDFDGSRISVPCGALATHWPVIDDAYSAHLRATGETSEDAQPSALPTCDEHYAVLLADMAEQKEDDPYRVWIARDARTIVIGYTKIERATGYSSLIDGYRPGAPQHVVTVTVDLSPDLQPHQIAELVFHATNAPDLEEGGPAEAIRDAIAATGYKGVEAHWSLSVGDTVTVDGTQLACGHVGWAAVTGIARRVAATTKRCEVEAVRGTGTGGCDAPLDEHGNCPRAGDHVVH